MNHRMPPDAELEEQFALRHEVHFTPGGVFARLMGAETVQAPTRCTARVSARPAPRVVIEGRADDRTPEAILVKDAPGFTLVGAMAPRIQRGARPGVAQAVLGLWRGRRRLGEWAQGDRGLTGR